MRHSTKQNTRNTKKTVFKLKSAIKAGNGKPTTNGRDPDVTILGRDPDVTGL